MHILFNLSLKLNNQKRPKLYAQYVIKTDQSLIFHGKIASKGKML